MKSFFIKKVRVLSILVLLTPSVGFSTTESSILNALNELKTAAKHLSYLVKQDKKNERTKKSFEAVYTRGTSGVASLAEAQDTLKGSERLKSEFIKIQNQTGVNFLKIDKKGNVSANKADVKIAGLSFFQLKNKTIYNMFLNELTGVEVSVDTKKLEELLTTKQKIKRKLAKGAKRFAFELGAFTAANGMLGFGSSASQSNPVAWDQAIDHATDPYGIAAFGGFVYTNHKMNNYLLKKRFSPGFATFAGMGAGLLVSTTLHELFIDTDLRECFFGSDKDPESLEEQIAQLSGATEAACAAAGERWLSRDKYVDLLGPELASLGVAAGLSQITVKAISDSVYLASRAAPRLVTPVAAAGVESVLLKGAAGGPLKMAISIGTFTIFLTWHGQADLLIKSLWNPLNFNHLGFSNTEELKKDKAEYSDFVRTYKKSAKEMNWLKNASFEELESLQKNVDSCEEKGRVAVGRHNQSVVRGKLYQECVRKAFPSLIIENKAAFNKARNELALSKFMEKQMNWHMLLEHFSEVYDVSKKFYKYMFDLKKELVLSDGEDASLSEKLKMESLRAYVDSIRVAGALKNSLYPETKMDVRFDHLADYLIFNMACGPSLKNLKSNEKYESSATSGVDLIKTPFGSSFKFRSPQVTATSKFICNSMNYRFLNMKNMSYDEKEQMVKGTSDVFNATWRDQKQKKYNSLLDYVIENLDEKAYNFSDDNEDEFLWWDDVVESRIADVWAEYEVSYVELVQNDLVPKLIDADGVISKTEQDINESLNLMIKLAGNTKRDITPLTKSVQELSQYLNSQFTKHKNLIEWWNNKMNLYEEQDGAEAVEKINELFSNVEDELYKMNFIEETHHEDIKLREGAKPVLTGTLLSSANDQFIKYFLKIIQVTNTLGFEKKGEEI